MNESHLQELENSTWNKVDQAAIFPLPGRVVNYCVSPKTFVLFICNITLLFTGYICISSWQVDAYVVHFLSCLPCIIKDRLPRVTLLHRVARNGLFATLFSRM